MMVMVTVDDNDDVDSDKVYMMVRVMMVAVIMRC